MTDDNIGSIDRDTAYLAAYPDLPVLLDQLQQQLDDQGAIIERQQEQISALTARLSNLEHR